jgi:hypothetical protein
MRMMVESILKNETSLKNKMNKGIAKFCTILALFFFYGQNSSGQITLVHSLSSNSSNYMTYEYFFDENINYYRNVTPNTNPVKLYNFDFSLYKTINIPVNIIKDGNVTGNKFFSKYIFNNDDKVEFLVEQSQKLRLINEDGDVLYDFGTTNDQSRWRSNLFIYEGKYYLSICRNTNNNTYATETYELPGTGDYSAIQSMNANPELTSPFPNPSRTEINLPYKLEPGETSIMYIYDVNGQLIVEKQIDSVFDRILLNVSNYKKGIYFYKVKDTTNKFIVN